MMLSLFKMTHTTPVARTILAYPAPGKKYFERFPDGRYELDAKDMEHDSEKKTLRPWGEIVMRRETITLG
jgi:hypothetical protein